jgi:penicillin-binding protein 2
MDVKDGGILALASYPNYDPNVFIQPYKYKSQLEEYLHAETHTLLNRCISGQYPPGSIFKILIATAALEEKAIKTDTIFNCTGAYPVGKRLFLCWDLDGHGEQNVIEAIANSCNVFFYQTGLKLGPDNIFKHGKDFGFGQRSEIDLPAESDGFLPSRTWKRRMLKERWYDGETANYSIGQGYLLVTPLQITRMVAVIASGGYLLQPHIVKRIQGEGNYLFNKKKLNISAVTLDAVKEGMYGAIEHGTATQARIPGVQWAGKTGTAQTFGEFKPHGWFGGFYPLENPRIVIVVFAEHGGSGGYIPANLAKKILRFIIAKELIPKNAD